MMPTVHITHLLTMLLLCMYTRDSATTDPCIMAITALDTTVTTGEEGIPTLADPGVTGSEDKVV